jgi:peptidoglycan-N-acetylglucosamine deacetylase
MKQNTWKYILALFLLLIFLIVGYTGFMNGYLRGSKYEGTYKKTKELLAQHNEERRKGIFFDKIMMGNPSMKAVALTFDDGPHPEFTKKILAILKKYDVKATFFVVGKLAEKNPDLIRDEFNDGHLIANHTYNHLNLNNIPYGETVTELLACNYVVKSIIDYDMVYFRPPGGDYDKKVISASSKEGFVMVLWTDDPGDYDDPGEKNIERYVLNNITNGGIILLHDGIQETIDVLPKIIETLKSRGFKFLTIEDMDRSL